MFFVRTVALLAILGGVCSCTADRKEQSGDLMAYVADKSHGLRKEQEWRGITLSVDYTPKAMVVRDLLDEKYTSQRGDSLEAALSDFMYFHFTLSRNGTAVTNELAGDPERYAAAQEYLASTIGHDIHLLAGGKSYDVYDFLYVQGNVLSKGSTVVVVFNNARVIGDNDFQFAYEDRFFGTGTSVFDFKGDSIALLKSQEL